MPAITTHILDTARGTPARNVPVTLDFLSSAPNGWQTINATSTNADGRVPGLVPTGFVLAAGTYRLTFDTAAYFASLSPPPPPTESFYPKVEIFFSIKDPLQHYHVPLLLAPYGYSTYRGS